MFENRVLRIFGPKNNEIIGAYSRKTRRKEIIIKTKT
jgi:hypothetical protein